jgi:hypothetical protein
MDTAKRSNTYTERPASVARMSEAISGSGLHAHLARTSLRSCALRRLRSDVTQALLISGDFLYSPIYFLKMLSSRRLGRGNPAAIMANAIGRITNRMTYPVTPPSRIVSCRSLCLVGTRTKSSSHKPNRKNAIGTRSRQLRRMSFRIDGRLRIIDAAKQGSQGENYGDSALN